MFYTIYKITNIINHKIYIGSHRTMDIDDDYMGSGKYLRHAIIKHGIENFKKEILFVFDTPEEMYAKEKEIVNQDFLAEENTYNLKVGGFGGWDYANKMVPPEERTRRGVLAGHVTAHKARTDPDFAKRLAQKKSNTLKRHYISGKLVTKLTPERNREASKLAQTESAKAKRNQTFKDINHQSGNRNSQYGSIWITNGIECKKVPYLTTIPNGWVRGRRITQNAI